MKTVDGSLDSPLFTTKSVLFFVAVIAFLLIIIVTSIRAREMDTEIQKSIAQKHGFNQGLGRPTSLTNLNTFTYITFLGSFQGNDGQIYLVALVGTNSAPTLFNTGTNEPPREARERSIILYDGKRLISIPKEKSE